MKRALAILIVSSELSFGQQVPLQSIVEHFTNTKCSICASRNPGFYTNLNNHPSILHLSIHPSSPYSTCPLSQQNTIDNDARTNFYGIYGGTPRLVINGNVISTSANYSSASIFTPYVGLTSSFLLKTSQIKIGTDSIQTTVKIYKKDTSSLTSASLFIGLVEDSIFINGGNGETSHFNVLRRSPTTSNGVAVSLPLSITDSITVKKTSYINPLWNQNRMYSIGILQHSTTKKVIQTGKSSLLSLSSGLQELTSQSNIILYPNPATDVISFLAEHTDNYSFTVFNSNGDRIKTGIVNSDHAINVSDLSSGFYIIHLSNQKQSCRKIISIQRTDR
jgi:hypothetical protein